MTEEQRQEILRGYYSGMRASSKQEIAAFAQEQALGARQRGPYTIAEQQAMSNFWGREAEFPIVPVELKFERPSMWMRLKRWLHS